jgi:hypothetical protein
LKKRIIKQIVTHLNPHLDEYLAIFLVKVFGKLFFQVSPDLKYGYICSTVGDPQIETKNPEALFLGVGRGMFDDHGDQWCKSCCELVAATLQVEESLSLVKILETVSFHDKNLARTPNLRTLPRTINLMHRYGYQPADVMKWIEEGLHALHQSEVRLLTEIIAEVEGLKFYGEKRHREIYERFMNFERSWMDLGLKQIAATFEEKEGGRKWLKFATQAHESQSTAFAEACGIATAKVQTIESRFGELRILAIDNSDGSLGNCEFEFDAASRNQKIGADIVVLRNSLGNTMAATNPTFKGNLTGLIKKLRIAEAHKRGQFIPPQFQVKEGTVAQFPHWHVHEGIEFRRVYNGTLTRPCVEPTVLSFDEIEKIILEWLAVEKFTRIPEGGKVSKEQVADAG